MSMGLYVLDDDGRPLPVDDFYAWSEWFMRTSRTLARDQIGAVDVSTIFLGIGYGDPPLLWESMVFTSTGVLTACRWATQAEALAGHAALVAKVRER